MVALQDARQRRIRVSPSLLANSRLPAILTRDIDYRQEIEHMYRDRERRNGSVPWHVIRVLECERGSLVR